MRTLCVSLVVVLALVSTAASSTNAGPVWNQVAASRHFDLYPVADNGSFAQHYHGSNFAVEFASMMNFINGTMGSQVEPGYDDMMNATLENWGSAATK